MCLCCIQNILQVSSYHISCISSSQVLASVTQETHMALPRWGEDGVGRSAVNTCAPSYFLSEMRDPALAEARPVGPDTFARLAERMGEYCQISAFTNIYIHVNTGIKYVKSEQNAEDEVILTCII